MKFLSNLGVLLLLNVICLSPVVACMAPEAQMSAAERACCHIMKSECGQMQMPASHGCCQKTLAERQHGRHRKEGSFASSCRYRLREPMAAGLLDLRRLQSEISFNSSASPPGNFAPALSSLRI